MNIPVKAALAYCTIKFKVIEMSTLKYVVVVTAENIVMATE
jgi:hypothetical protein